MNVRWRYEDFEASFLYFVQELDLQGLLLKNDKQNQIAVAIQVLQGRLSILREQQEKVLELHLANTSETSLVARKLAEFEQQIGEIETEIARATSAQAAVKAEVGRFTESKDQIKTLIDRLQDTGDEKVYELRARVASSLQALVSGIRIAGAGSRHLPRSQHAQGKRRITSFEPPDGKVISLDQSASKIDQTDWRFFEVKLKDGSRRIVKPGAKDPLFLRAQTATGLGGGKGVELWRVQIEP